MSKLIKAEFYKIFHSRYYWGICLIYLLMYTSNLFDSIPRTDNILQASVRNVLFSYFIIFGLAVVFFGNEFEQRNHMTAIAAGKKRSDYFLAKTIVFLILSLVMTVVPIWIHILGSIPFLGVTMETDYIMNCMKILVPAFIAMGEVAVFSGLVFRSVAGILITGAVTNIALIAAFNSKYMSLFGKVIPVGHSVLIAAGTNDRPALYYAGISMIWTVVMLVVSYLVFRRADL